MAKCEICTIIEGEKQGIHNKEHILDMKGGWVLNHNDSSNAYLGYLVLTTKEHLPDWEGLSLENQENLGKNVKWVDANLRRYWYSVFPDDPIEQIYFAYLNETGYIRHFQGKDSDPRESLHVHIHVLPRTKTMLTLCAGDMVGWDLLKMRSRFPLDYLLDRPQRTRLIDTLKNQYLREQGYR